MRVLRTYRVDSREGWVDLGPRPAQSNGVGWPLGQDHGGQNGVAVSHRRDLDERGTYGIGRDSLGAGGAGGGQPSIDVRYGG